MKIIDKPTHTKKLVRNIIRVSGGWGYAGFRYGRTKREVLDRVASDSSFRHRFNCDRLEMVKHLIRLQRIVRRDAAMMGGAK